MQASVLIVDGIATNRVALKVKLTSAWYDVTVEDAGQSALDAIEANRPNLVLINDTLPDMTLETFCSVLSKQLGDETPPMLALSRNRNARERLLSLGIEDVLDHPVDNKLLVARIRGIIRTHASEAEWRLRDSTSRALGFAEMPSTFQAQVPIVCLFARQDVQGQNLIARARKAQVHVGEVLIDNAMRDVPATQDGAVVVLALPLNQPDNALTVVSDLRAGLKTRHKAVLVLVPDGREDLAATALDLGANEVVVGNLTPRELELRTRRLHSRHIISNSMRKTMQTGVEAALRDPLTGLYNRRYALPHLERVAEKSQQSGRAFAVMIADLDHFKRINDWHGHSAGDAVLVECARRLSNNIRAEDLVARIGGEEFLIVLPGTTRIAARQAALRLCNKISEEPILLPGGKNPVRVTVSIGLALSDTVQSADLDGPALQDVTSNGIIDRADKALYRAKELGRNRFIVEQRTAA